MKIPAMLTALACGVSLVHTDAAHAAPSNIETAAPAKSATVSVYATGLNNPRGLKFGPDGLLYVAEGGIGGSDSTVGKCPQVVPPVGPYTGSPDGARISRINASGERETVADKLPSNQNAAGAGGFVLGVADIAFLDGRLYGLLAGGGCSHGVSSVPNGIVRVGIGGSWDLVANLSAFQASHPTKVIEPDDFEPDGTWFSMVALDDNLYAIDPNHGELDRIGSDGRIRRIADISASQGHIVPTAMTVYDGDFYVGNLNVFPIVDGSSKILRIDRHGQIDVVATGLTTVLGVAIDRRGRIYVLENTTGNPFPTPFTGRIVRVRPNGSLEVMAKDLLLPTGMTLGPDGNLYVSAGGFGLPPLELGQILKVELNNDRD
jgi:hypothetical protein